MIYHNNNDTEIHPANWSCGCGEILHLYHTKNLFGDFACHCGNTNLQLVIHTIKLSQLTQSMREALENS